jgi:23S rRNA G2445 N2-methylase RlmL
VIPNYKEEEGILKSTLDKLSSHDLAKTSYLVFLGMEKHEVDHQKKAHQLIQAYKQNFRHMGYTAHVLQEG